MRVLRECPFCRSKDLWLRNETISMKSIYCKGCNSRGAISRDEEGAIKAWNTRIPNEDLSCEGVKTVNDILCALSQVRATPINISELKLESIMIENYDKAIEHNEEKPINLGVFAKSIFKYLGGSDE